MVIMWLHVTDSMMQVQASPTRLSANYMLYIVLPAESCSLLGFTILTE